MDLPIEGYSLVPATGDDMQYIVSCAKEDILSSVTEKERELSDTWLDDSLSMVKFGFVKRPMLDEFFLLKKDGINAGMLWLGVSRDQFVMDNVGYVLGIYVEKKHRRKGLGRAMMEFAEKWSTDKGFVTLSLNVGEPNTTAVKMYESLGYSVQSRVMRKNLK